MNKYVSLLLRLIIHDYRIMASIYLIYFHIFYMDYIYIYRDIYLFIFINIMLSIYLYIHKEINLLKLGV
jgi:hypothetical protein